MTNSELRSVAIMLRNRVTALQNAVTPVYTTVSGWTLNGADASLPTIAAVKAALTSYEAIEKSAMNLYDEIRNVKKSADDATPTEG